MKKVAVMFASGFEEIEAVSVVDILRRAGLEVFSVGLDKKMVVGAHNIEIKADMLLENLNVDEFSMVVLPGGLPGAEYLAKSEKMKQTLKEFDSKNLKIAAICAAPWALSTAGVLKDKYTCYPGFEKQVNHKGYIDNQNVVVDKNIITSRGPATAMEFALILVRELLGESKYEDLKKDLLFK